MRLHYLSVFWSCRRARMKRKSTSRKEQYVSVRMKSAALFSFAFAPKEREILSTFFHSKSPYTKYEREQNALLREVRNEYDDDDDNTENDDDDEAKSDV